MNSPAAVTASFGPVLVLKVKLKPFVENFLFWTSISVSGPFSRMSSRRAFAPHRAGSSPLAVRRQRHTLVCDSAVDRGGGGGLLPGSLQTQRPWQGVEGKPASHFSKAASENVGAVDRRIRSDCWSDLLYRNSFWMEVTLQLFGLTLPAPSVYRSTDYLNVLASFID